MFHPSLLVSLPLNPSRYTDPKDPRDPKDVFKEPSWSCRVILLRLCRVTHAHYARVCAKVFITHPSLHQFWSHSAKGPWNESLNSGFPPNYVIPQSSKVGHWMRNFESTMRFDPQKICWFHEPLVPPKQLTHWRPTPWAKKELPNCQCGGYL